MSTADRLTDRPHLDSTMAGPDLSTGMRLNERYVAERLLGDQPTGRFLVAVDTALGGRATILVPRLAGVGSKQFVASMQKELERCAPLADTLYCTLRDIGITSAGEPFVVVPRPQGSSLTECLRNEGCLATDRALSVAIQLADLVRRAHAVGIMNVSPDPSRIIVDARPNGMHRVSMVDLGLHRNVYGPAVRYEHRATLFESPQVRRRVTAEPSVDPSYEDPRDDVFSLTAVLHAMVFGVAPPPMSPHGPSDGSGWTALADDGRGLARRLEACLHTVLLKGLAPKRSERFSSVEALRRALAGLQQLMSLSAPAFELLAATRGRLGQPRDGFDFAVQAPELERAAEARARVRQVVKRARQGGANLASLPSASTMRGPSRSGADRLGRAPSHAQIRPGAFFDMNPTAADGPYPSSQQQLPSQSRPRSRSNDARDAPLEPRADGRRQIRGEPSRQPAQVVPFRPPH